VAAGGREVAGEVSPCPAAPPVHRSCRPTRQGLRAGLV